MRNKILFSLAVLFISFASQSQIVTSKKEAQNKGLYEKPIERAVAANKAVLKSKPSTSKAKKTIINEKPDTDLIVEPLENYMALQLINNAMEFLGVNYRGGGTSKAGMDCSGMVTAVFNIFEKKLPRSSNEMARVGEKVNNNEIKKGDLVFFRTNGKKVINHVGLVIEADSEEIKFIHSSTQQGVIISSTKEPYYKRTFAQANRVL